MKKVALSLAGVLAAAAFAPEASALPVFARQTGMACSACHFQHFPLLNGFGRSFKASGFTLMGAQGKVEGDDLSLPNVVNAAVLTSMGYEKTSATQVAGAITHNGVNAASSTGAWYTAAFNGEASLFLGGRGSDNVGYLTEVTMGNGAAAADSFKTPILFDIAGGVRAGVVLFTTNGQGASYGFETLNTGANAVHSITNTVGFNGQYINAVSAQQYIGTGAAATGASIVANSDIGFINVTKFAQAGPGSGGAYAALGSTYARVAATLDLGGWDTAFGVQNWRGNSVTVLPNPAAGTVIGVAPAQTVAPAAIASLQDSKASAVDAQAQGSVGSMPLGIYVTYAKAPKSTAIMANSFNGSTVFDRSSINLAAELGVVPEKVTVGMAVRQGKAGVADNVGANATDNAIYLTATYKLSQNLLTRLSYVTQSGTYWDTTTATGTNATDIGKSSYTINLYALF